MATQSSRVPVLMQDTDGVWRFPDEYAPASVAEDATAASASATSAFGAAADASAAATQAASDAAAADAAKTAAEAAAGSIDATVGTKVTTAIAGQKALPSGLASLDANGKVPTSQLPASSGGTEVIQILQVGDSLTENWGNSNNNIEIKNAYGSANVVNIGKGGQTSPQISARHGGVPVLLTPAGNKFNGVGPTTVTVSTNLFYTNASSGTTSQDGSSVGRLGALQRVKNAGVYTYTFIPATDGVDVAAPSPVPFLTGFEWRNRAMTICIGRNDVLDSTPQQIVDRIRGIIEWNHRDPSQHIVLSIPANRTLDSPGSSGRIALDAVNAAIKAAFPRQWVDWAGYLTSTVTLQQVGITPTSQDLIDIADGITPQSFRGDDDDLHFNAVAYDAINVLILREMAARGLTPLVTPVPPTITTTALPSMTVGVAVSGSIASTGTEAITFSVVGGALPAGVSMSSAGVLSGTPTAAGSYSVTVRASNGVGSVDKTFAGTVSGMALHSYGLTDATHRYVGSSLPDVGQLATSWPDVIGSMHMAHSGTTAKVEAGPGGVDKAFVTPNTATSANTQRVYNTTGDNTVRTVVVVYNNRTPANSQANLVSIGGGNLALGRGSNGVVAASVTSGSLAQSTGSMVSGWKVGFAWYDETTNELGIDINGTEVVVTTTRGAAPSNTAMIGVSGGAAVDVAMAEVIMFSRVITDAERATVRTALKAHFAAIDA